MKGSTRAGVLAMLMVVGGAAGAQEAGAPVLQCAPIRAELNEFFSIVTLVSAGTVTGDLEGAESFVLDADSNRELVSTPRSPLERPTFRYTGERTISTAEGDLILRTAGVYEFTLFGLGTALETVIAGTGRFAGASGELYSNYQGGADFSTIAGTLTGELCLPAPTEKR